MSDAFVPWWGDKEVVTDCYVEYDENGKEIFIPKTK